MARINYKTIHITGTNGKGSVSAKIAHALSVAGYKVGRFISPHLMHFEERISINGSPIERQRLLGANLTSFQSITDLAFDYFSEQKVDIAVIEVGIGGSKDPTNIIHPLLSIITSISLDHTALLGETLDEIARDKSGIIKAGVPVVVGPYAKLEPIYMRAKELKCAVHEVQPVPGYFEDENRAIARKALELLLIQEPYIIQGLNFRLPCRFEERQEILFDVAHNPGGFQKLLEALQLHYAHEKWRFVVGMSRDKDIKECLRILAPHAERFYFVSANDPRAASSEQLAQILTDLGDYSYSIEGFARAVEETRAGERLIVCGSFKIIPEILHQLELKPLLE